MYAGRSREPTHPCSLRSWMLGFGLLALENISQNRSSALQSHGCKPEAYEPEEGGWRPLLIMSGVGGILKDSSQHICRFLIGLWDEV